MPNPNSGPIGRGLDQAHLPLIYREYRRLLIRSYVLRLRMGWLSALVTLLTPFATAGMLLTLRQWFENLRADVAEFGRLSRAFRAQLRAQPLPQPQPQREFQNPWA